MCIYCVEIQQGKYKSYDEFADTFNPDSADFDLDHYFNELHHIIVSLKWSKPQGATATCSCGAKYTSFPGKHLKYCEEVS